jgi:hypothetical protein
VSVELSVDRQRLRREISKLIAAIEREWKEELGAPEAVATERALRKTHQFLTGLTDGKPLGLETPETLSDLLGAAWLESHPWAIPHVAKIQKAIRQDEITLAPETI